jgi:hypothetical protein
MSKAKIISVTLVDARSRNLNAACGLVAFRYGMPSGYEFHMRKFFNPHVENTLPLLSKLLRSVHPDTTDVILESTTYILSPRGMSSAIPTPWWDIWRECRGKHYTVHRRDVGALDPQHKMLISILRWLLDDHAHHATFLNWTKVTIGWGLLEAHLDQTALDYLRQPKRESETVNTINSIILPFVHAEGDDINASFNNIEREVDLAFELKQEREAHEKTRAALAEQTTASQRIANERQIERSLQAHSSLTQKAVANVTKLLLKGDGGELEQGKNGRLREKFGARNLDEVAADYLRQNPHFLGSNEESKKAGGPALDRATMSAKEKGQYIEEHGSEKYFELPHTTKTQRKSN